MPFGNTLHFFSTYLPSPSYTLQSLQLTVSKVAGSYMNYNYSNLLQLLSFSSCVVQFHHKLAQLTEIEIPDAASPPLKLDCLRIKGKKTDAEAKTKLEAVSLPSFLSTKCYNHKVSQASFHLDIWDLLLPRVHSSLTFLERTTSSVLLIRPFPHALVKLIHEE